VVPDELKRFVAKGYETEFAARIQHEAGSLAETIEAIRALPLNVCDVMVGCETGVLLGDELSQGLGVRSNGTLASDLRRNKWLQTEAVRDAGLNACGQSIARCSADVEAYLATKPVHGNFKVSNHLAAHGHVFVYPVHSPHDVEPRPSLP
jgi:hypothetical protein